MLDDIGFYTLSEKRAAEACETSPMWRCELILTTKCNFNCAYCRGPEALPECCRDDMDPVKATITLGSWIDDGLKNVRFSGGEPTMYPWLRGLARFCAALGVERIAVSTNGSRSREIYLDLAEAGVNDWSISLDACCAAHGDYISGKDGSWDTVVNNIRLLASFSYVTVGVVLTDENISETVRIVQFAHDLGVADIRLVSAAQRNRLIPGLETIPGHILAAHPILAYRVQHFLEGRNVRGLEQYDSHRCHLALDDSVVAGSWHFPCVIHMREGGNPIGPVGPGMRQARVEWSRTHDTHKDPICRQNCLDVCIDYNNRYKALRGPTPHF